MPNAIYENGDSGVEVDPTAASGLRGYNGWSMVTALIADGERRVRRVVDWTGGEGTKPDVGGYLGPLGLVDDIADATDDRGTKGDKGDDGDQGATGADGKSAYQVAVDNGFVGTEAEWLDAYVNETAAAATASAIEARDVASTKATEASTSETNAAASAGQAAAAAGGVIYDTTAAGIAATVNGQFFLIKGDGVATYALMYKNVATVATLIASYPSKTALDAALATLAATYDQVGYLTVSDIFIWKDAAGNIVGRVKKDTAAWDILLLTMRTAGFEASIYETVGDGATFYVTDANNYILFQSTAPGQDLSTEMVAARGDRTTLTTRLDTSLNAYGLPNEAKPWGQYLLRETRGRLAMMLYGGVRQLSIAAIGDSYTQSATRWIQSFAARLMTHADYGAAGPGWCGFGRFTTGTPSTVNGNVNPASYPVTRSGTWADVYNTSKNSPDRSHNVSSEALAAQRVTGVALPVLSAATLFWINTADGVMEYRWNDTGAWTTINVQGTVDQLGFGSVVTGMPVSGAWTFEVRVVSGTCKPAGVHFASAAKGVTVNKLAGSGARLSQWLVSDNWGAGLAQLAPNLIIFMEGPNSQGNNVVPSIWGSDFATWVDIARAACPTADILIAMPPDNQRVNLYPMPLYAYEAYKVAKTKGCAFVDMQQLFGVNPADYAFGSTRPWFDVDTIHPDPATGGKVIAGAVLSIVNPY
ncbi:hypothetical protein NKJ72_11795 [Mesorhizobium sp. M0045]|uniref:SGNH/GDSL hydrolase family protein n=1 Tax=Mesorhizobium sp. M0045 TaxID=2956857 RepID=UPI00333A89B8